MGLDVWAIPFLLVVITTLLGLIVWGGKDFIKFVRASIEAMQSAINKITTEQRIVNQRLAFGDREMKKIAKHEEEIGYIKEHNKDQDRKIEENKKEIELIKGKHIYKKVE